MAGNVERAWGPWREAVNVQDIGARPGVAAASNLGFFQEAFALSVARRIPPYIPAVDRAGGESYQINDELSVAAMHGLAIIGDGPDSYIEQTTAAKAVFRGLRMHPFVLASFVYQALDPITAGARVLTFTTASDADDYAVGEIVYVAHTTTFPDGSFNIPIAAFFREVIAVGSGTITLDRPVPVAMSGAQVARTDDLGVDGDGVTIGLVKGLRLIGLGVSTTTTRGWMADDGIYGGEVDVYVHQGPFLYSQNAICHSDVKVRGYFGKKALETAFGSHNSKIDVRGSYQLLDTAPTANQPVSVHQNSWYIEAHVDVDAGDPTYTQAVQIHGKFNKVMGQVRAPGVTSSLLNFVSGAAGLTEGNEADLIIHGGAPADLLDIGGTGGNSVVGNRIRGRYYGTPSSGIAARFRTTVDGNEMQAWLESGDIYFHSLAANNVVRNSRFDDIDGHNDATIAAQTIINNWNARSVAARGLHRQLITTQNVTTTTPNTPVGSGLSPIGVIAIPADTLRNTDTLTIRLSGNVAGTTDAKTIRLADDTGAIHTLSFTAGETGRFAMELTLKVLGNTAYDVYGTLLKGTAITGAALRRTGVDLTGSVRTLQVQAWVANAADSIAVYDLDVRPTIRGYATQ